MSFTNKTAGSNQVRKLRFEGPMRPLKKYDNSLHGMDPGTTMHRSSKQSNSEKVKTAFGKFGRMSDQPVRNPDGSETWNVCCPLHNDTNPSASLTVTAEGKSLFKCHAYGCGESDGKKLEQLADALNLDKRDFFPVPGFVPPAVGSASAIAIVPRKIPVDPRWDLLSKDYMQDLKETELKELGKQTGLPVSALRPLGIGRKKCTSKEGRPYSVFTIPEVNAGGIVVGIATRSDKGDIGFVKLTNGPKGHRGLIIPKGWKHRGKNRPLLVVEGATDVAAAWAMGFLAIGKPSCSNHLDEELASWIKANVPPDRKIVVVGEWDMKTHEDGTLTWPGRDGAVKTCQTLKSIMPDRDIKWCLPPGKKKDLREWYLSVEFPRGEKLAVHFEEHARCTEPTIIPGGLQCRDAATFLSRPCPSVQSLVKNILVVDLPIVMAGPMKSGKTSTLADLSVSLATATPFLGRFNIPKRRRVWLLTGEAGESVLYSLLHRICKARNVKLEPGYLNFDLQVPQLSNAEELQRVLEFVEKNKIELLAIDPLYFAGLDPSQSGNIDGRGAFLRKLVESMQQVKCQLLLCAHTKKHTVASREPLGLNEISGAGVGEFAAQWMLLSNREKFDSDRGLHQLWLASGNRHGQSNELAVDLLQGKQNSDLGKGDQRYWEVTVLYRSELEKIQVTERGAKLEMRITDLLSKHQLGIGITDLRRRIGGASNELQATLDRLITQGKVRRDEKGKSKPYLFVSE